MAAVAAESNHGSYSEDVEKHLDSSKTPSQDSQLPAEDTNLVNWTDDSDPENPQNWPAAKKWIITTILSTLTFCVTFASSVFSTATAETAKEFHVSNEVMVLGSSLFVLGFALGPVVWGPLSELYGRKRPMFTGLFVFAIFNIPVAVAHNVETILICRFLGGVFGCSPMAIVGGALADFWNPTERGVAVCSFAGATFIGPLAGPIAGSFIVASSLGWRWTVWLTLIMIGVFGSLAYVVVPESSAPVLLSWKAKRLRKETGNQNIHAAHYSKKVSFSAILTTYVLRPIKMLAMEPILLLLTIYMAFVYGVLYLFFFSYPIAFSGQRGWSTGLASLPFLSIMVGIVFGSTYIVYFTKTQFASRMAKNGRTTPEDRLPPMIVGGILLPIGLFWFAWTSNKNITWVPQVLAGIPTGAGVLIIFMQGFNYIIDVYLMYANSALAGNALIRSLLGAGFPLFASAMYNRLGVDWATSVLAFLAVAMVPVPVLFLIYGQKMRSWSRMSLNKQ
ncbi:hypothetical protein TrVFT333_005270 [Trichoderma virens FT-333]|nr:hypothetical protein TrVFT333_005270 [Trichoderma virens FT-333]